MTIQFLVLFQFWWHFSVGNISVLETFQFWWHFSFDYLHTISGCLIGRVFNLFLAWSQITEIPTRLILSGNQIMDIVFWSWCIYWYLWLAQIIFEVRSFPKYVTLWWSEWYFSSNPKKYLFPPPHRGGGV